MNIQTRAIHILTLILLTFQIGNSDTREEPAIALELLEAQATQFQQQVVRVSERVYTAVGFHGANTSMIVGTDGVIIVDTLMGPASAARAFKALRAYSDKPVKAIIYTHSHGDHTGGASAFVDAAMPQIYASVDFGSAEGSSKAAAPIKAIRNVRQFGRELPVAERTHRGIAPAGTDDSDRGKGYIPPNVHISQPVHSTLIAGIELEFHLGPGETNDALFVWLPKDKVLFAGDNFYQSFPNLYAIRGTTYRDVLEWSKSVQRMADLKPQYLVPGHTLPITGQSNTVAALEDYSEAIRSIYQQTIAGINEGKGFDQLAHEISLPPHLQNKTYLTEFYGTIPHAVRAIYTGLLGWFDGNPTKLNPLEPKQRALKIARLAGGKDKLIDQMHTALDRKEYQWAMELSDHLKWLNPGDPTIATQTKIKALRALAAQEYNAPNRNYYLSYANELESGKLKEPWQ